MTGSAVCCSHRLYKKGVSSNVAVHAYGSYSITVASQLQRMTGKTARQAHLWMNVNMQSRGMLVGIISSIQQPMVPHTRWFAGYPCGCWGRVTG